MANRVDSLVKIRDGAQMILDGVNEILESMSPYSKPSDVTPDLAGVMWKAATGDKGPDEKSEEDLNNPNYKLLLKALQEHSGKMSAGNYFVWTFSDNKTIGRKKRL